MPRRKKVAHKKNMPRRKVARKKAVRKTLLHQVTKVDEIQSLAIIEGRVRDLKNKISDVHGEFEVKLSNLFDDHVELGADCIDLFEELEGDIAERHEVLAEREADAAMEKED